MNHGVASALVAAAAAERRLSRRQLAVYGYVVYEAEDMVWRSNQKAIAAETGMDQADVSKALRQLVTTGYLTPDTTHQRPQWYRIAWRALSAARSRRPAPYPRSA